MAGRAHRKVTGSIGISSGSTPSTSNGCRSPHPAHARDVERAAEKHAIASAELMATYER
jgi:hypothetical protein